MKKFFTFLLSIYLLSNLNYAYSISPDVFIQSTVNRAAETLSGNHTKQERIEKLKNIALETVDIEGISFYSLGSYRKNLSNDQLTRYKIVFKDYFLKSFSSRLAEYTNPEIEVKSKLMIITLLYQAYSWELIKDQKL